MKKYTFILFAALLLISMTGCDFLDVVPDEMPTEEDAFKDPLAAKRFLYSCYSYIPNPRDGASSLDLFTGDEVITAFEHETFANFLKGNYTANAPIISYWNSLFSGIKQCYLLKNNIDKVPRLGESDKKDYIAQADFLIAYYHYLLVRCYGPVILVKEEPNMATPAAEYLGRSTLDECVEWIAEQFESAAERLPDSRFSVPRSVGLATAPAAKGIVARMYLYAASPLFNGNNKFYSELKNPDGTLLMPTSYDANKWIKAKDAAKQAIDAAEKGGFRLYLASDATDTALPEPSDPTQRALRFTIIDRASKEVVWSDTRGEGTYALQNKSRPYWGASNAWNGVSPTLAMLDRFYTKNGLPINEDPEFNYTRRFDVSSFPSGDGNGEGETTYMNLNREPRYYAWVSFHGGYYECQGDASGNGDGKWAYLPQYKRGINNMKLITYFKKDDNCGIRNRTNDYSPAGFLNKKGVSPRASVSESGGSVYEYPWPIIRVGELYLNYAEACVETNDLEEAKKYINRLRERAGLPTLETAWGSIGKTLTQEKMREIVRQERMIELYLEGHNFWDMRRWLLAGEYFSVIPEGLNVKATTMQEFSQRTSVAKTVPTIRSFTAPRNYLLPIPYNEVQKNSKLVQNPGY